MDYTRRQFLQHSAALAGMVAAGCVRAEATTSQILVNHVGFTPSASKFCMLWGASPTEFDVIEQASGKVVHHGVLSPRPGDLGQYLVGDFSEVVQAGTFFIQAGGKASAAFQINSAIYQSAIEKMVGYFARQRCGASQSGYHAPCHLDDGRRTDNHQHHDATGGWHDACDLRKWVNATIYGMIGLHQICDLRPGDLDTKAILDELRWGNSYFLKMQEPDGYVMDYCGGDDGNRFTNNVVGDEDDRPLHVDPCELPAQFQFVAAQAAMARLTRRDDPNYSEICLHAAQKCLEWCNTNRSPGAVLSLAAGVLACVQLSLHSPSPQIANLAAGYLKKMLRLQVVDSPQADAAPRGYFLTAPDHLQPLREVMHGNLPLLALCEAINHFPKHDDMARWKEALEQHVHYLLRISELSPFGIIPFGLYPDKDPGGGRKLGKDWYRWFMMTHNETSDSEWWVGINAHLASCGIGLLKAGRLINDAKAKALAQRQLDWILGTNPFDASTVTDVGRNQPRQYATNAFSPHTPPIPGGVMNGIGGNERDEPALDAGSWNTCEYWTPMVCYTMWLAAELEADRPARM